METSRLLLLLLPVLLIQLGLMIFAIIDLIKIPLTNGPKWMWGVIIVLVNIIGPILYFAIGRRNY
ncbi:PLD nuclease N-terminal domain-containing protein [Planococcus sp. CAU13]|uniref:PLD nuclease N-terminal domain-containing protein n=1 Tax=Planococcus sp. CAU13 TaxID=1541197 RepID=UPI00052FDDFC|nr:PLD nuclease N-terminal domain-containing protein [Planococcus sp. CAU13]